MDILQFARHVALSELANEISGVEGPFPHPSGHSGNALIWLENGRGVSVLKNGRGHNDDNDLVEMAVIREIPYSPVWCDSVARPWELDYSTPVTRDVIPGCTVSNVVDALKTLSELPENDPHSS